ncbi:MAG: disulfide bond formation protein B [Pseudorhodobacter sp.]
MRSQATLRAEGRLLAALAGLGSAALLLAAFGFQYIGGLFPCELCLWQRWPHAVAIAIAVLSAFLGARHLGWLGALAVLTTAGIAFFHSGVEMGWWEGLASCSGGSLANISASDLLNPDVVIAEPVRCDAVPWAFLGLSMASWNGILSVALAFIWIAAARRG